MNNNLIMLYTTLSCKEEVVTLSNLLIKKKLCVCINSLPTSSYYQWNDKMHHSSEHVLFIKSIQRKKEALIRFLEKNHPYDTPPILEIPVIYSNSVFQTWANNQIS